MHAERAHWHVFNMGGRGEAQFNVGMYGGPPIGNWLRIGIGCDVGEDDGGPERLGSRARDLSDVTGGVSLPQSQWALITFSIGMYDDMAITPIALILPAMWIVYRPPVLSRSILVAGVVTLSSNLPNGQLSLTQDGSGNLILGSTSPNTTFWKYATSQFDSGSLTAARLATFHAGSE